MRLYVAGGRVALCEGESGQSRTVAAGEPESAHRQQLQLQVRPPCVVVQYESVDPTGRLLLRFCEKRHLLIERSAVDLATTPSVRWQQPRSGPVRLTVEGPTKQVISADSLWHLALIHPRESRELLFPLLESLSPDWNLARLADEVELALLEAAAEADVAADEKSWDRLVHDLASDCFQKRQAADVALRSGGQGVAAFLVRLDPRALSAEQRVRVQRICESYADGAADTPKRVTAWLLGDRSVWLALLSRDDAATRARAAEHLSRLVGRPISFDPHADKRTREQQVAELTRRIGVKK